METSKVLHEVLRKLRMILGGGYRSPLPNTIGQLRFQVHVGAHHSPPHTPDPH